MATSALICYPGCILSPLMFKNLINIGRAISISNLASLL